MDWIKVECSTLTKPEVISIASEMKLSRHHVIGCIIEFWCYVQEVSRNGRVDAPVDACEELLALPRGFLASMAHVGWLKITPTGFVVPHFEYHMSSGAKARSLNSLRQNKWRQNRSENRNGHVDGHVDGDASLEKRREEEIRRKKGTPQNGRMKPGDAFARVIAKTKGGPS